LTREYLHFGVINVSILTYGEVGIFVSLGDGLDKVGRLAQVVGLQFLLKGPVRRLREQGLLLQYGQNTCGHLR
jgi:hypothetical protein